MQSAKSYFNFSLFRKNLARFWPIWGAYLLLWLLLPLSILNDGWEKDTPLGMLTPGLFFAFFFGVLAAMAVFSYLYNSKSVHLMHSLPIRREGLFLTNYLSGLSFLLLPHVVVFLLTLLAGGFRYPWTVFLWFVAQSLMCLFFYSFAVFCAMFTGNLLALPVFYGILNFLVLGLSTIITSLLREFLFGFAGGSGLDALVTWLTPVVQLATRIGYDYTTNHVIYLRGLSSILLYGFIGVLLAVAALFIYRRRRLETAGDLVSIRWVRPVFKYGVAFCAAVSVGTWLYSAFRSLLPSGDWAILIPLLFCGLVGYFAADMLLKKNFQVFAKAWKGALCFSLVLVAAFFATNLDLFGFNNTPARASIASVCLHGAHTSPDDSGSFVDLTLTDSADLDAVLTLHSSIAARKNDIRRELANAQDSGDHDGYASLYLEYTLTDGRIVRRDYDISLYAERLDSPDSIESTLTELLNRPSIVDTLYWGNAGITPDAKLVDVTLDVHRPPNQGYATVSLDEQETRDALLAAVKADMAAGRIGRRYLMDTPARYENCYYNDLTFFFYQTGTSAKEANGQLAAPADSRRDWAITVTLQTTATETLKVLEELGFTDGDALVTWAEQIRRDDAEIWSEDTEYSGVTLRPVG